jgi:hypothetical protein
MRRNDEERDEEVIRMDLCGPMGTRGELLMQRNTAYHPRRKRSILLILDGEFP